MGIKGKHVWGLLPWYIQVDILSRLTTKDLRNLEGVCKDWQSIIKSPRFHMLQINANPNQDGFIMHSYEYQGKCVIQPLSSNKIYKLDFSTNGRNILESRILAVSNGLVLVKHYRHNIPNQLLVHNPITRQCIELPQLPTKAMVWERNCKFLEHDLQSSSYKIFLASNDGVYIYSSSSCKWQAIDSFSNFKLNLESKIYDWAYSCIIYKNNMYIAFSTLDEKWMMVVYNPKDDAWSNLCLSKEETYCLPCTFGGQLIIVDDRLFFVYVDNYHSSNNNNIIAIFEMKIEDRLFIQITKFTCTNDFSGFVSYDSIIGFGNKIIIMNNTKDIFITFNLSTNEQQVFRNNDVAECSCKYGKYPYKYTLVSP